MAANSYTMSQIYAVVKQGQSLPAELEGFVNVGEGANNGALADGRTWFKNMFIGNTGIADLRTLVHAEDAGVLDLKTAKEMRAILEAEAIAIGT